MARTPPKVGFSDPALFNQASTPSVARTSTPDLSARINAQVTPGGTLYTGYAPRATGPSTTRYTQAVQTTSGTEVNIVSSQNNDSGDIVTVYNTNKDISVSAVNQTFNNYTVTNPNAYSNSNVAAFLPTYTGVLAAGSLTVAGATDLGDLSNVYIGGGTNGQVLSTDGSGSLTWVDDSGGGTGFGNLVFNGDTISSTNDIVNIIGNNFARITSDGQDWTFESDGNLTLPSNTSNINYANGSPYNSSLYGNSNVATFLASFGSNTITTTGNINAGNLTTSGNIGATNGVFTTVAGSLTTAAQPNITSTGTLTTLSVSGTSNLGPVSNVRITGGAAGQLLSTNGSGVLSWADSPTNISNGTSNVNIATSGGHVTTSVSGTANVLVVTSTGANITGNLNAGNIITSGTLSATGGATFGANVAMTNRNITGLANPTAAFDAATKLYVDTFVQGLDNKDSVSYATTTELPPYAYTNGASGVGASITATNNGILSIDGQAVTSGQRVLIKNEINANAPYNGIYIVTNEGAVDEQYVLTRATDFDSWAEVPGAFAFVENGSTNADTGWVCIADAGGTIGTTPVSFTQFSGAGTYIAGAGLTLTGTVFSVNASQTQVTAVGTLTSLSVLGNTNAGNVNATGGVFTTVAGSLTTAAQPNITSVGTLTTLSVSGNITGGNITTDGVVSATGNITGDYFIGNGSQLTGLNTSGISNGTSNINIATINGNVSTVVAGTTRLSVNTGGANITGTLSVSANANVGNIGATNGVFTTVEGSLTTNAQPNITSTGILTSLSVSGNSNIGNIGATTGVFTSVTGTLTTNAQPNVTSVGTLTSLSVSGNSNVGNIGAAGGVFTTVAGSLTTNAQPNITSVGTLTSLSVSGNSNVGNIGATNGVFTTVEGSLTTQAQPNITSVGTLTSLNVSANANVGNIGATNGVFTTVQGSLTTNAQPNITSTGTLTTLSVSGNSNVGNIGAASGVFTSVTGTLTTNAQPNITSVGTLASLNVSGVSTLGLVGNVVIDGGSAGQYLQTNGSGGLSWAAVPSGDGISNGTSNINIATINGNVTTVVAGTTRLSVNNGGANITGTLSASGNANVGNIGAAGGVFTTVAGSLTTPAQPNITSTGNLPYLQVSNSANADGVIRQLSSGNIAFSAPAIGASYQITTQYHPNASTNYPGERVVRSRGNVTTPTTAVNGDRILARAGLAYNGTTNAISVSEVWTAVGTVTTGADAAWTGGQWNITTGNPQGDTSNVDASSSQNSLRFSNSGTLSIEPGTPANTSLGQTQSAISITNYGASTANLVPGGLVNFQRARGNRDSVENVQVGDQTGRITFTGYSDGAYQSSQVASIRSFVASSYTDNDNIVPQDIQISALSNVSGTATFRTTTFFGNGLVSFPSATSAVGNITGANLITSGIVSATGNITGDYFIGNGSQLTGLNTSSISNGTSNISIATNGNVTTVVAGTTRLSVNTGGANITGTLSASGNANVGNIGAAGGVFTTVAGSLTTNAQPNITSVGTLTSLSVSGNATVGNLIGTLANGTSNVRIAASDGNVTITSNGSETWTFDTTGNLTFPDGTVQTTAPVAELSFSIQSSNFVANAGGRYGVNTSGGAVTATLPATPATGVAIFFADAGGAYASNNLTINRNGQTIMGSSTNLTVSTNNQSVGLFYNGATWRIYNAG